MGSHPDGDKKNKIKSKLIQETFYLECKKKIGGLAAMFSVGKASDFTVNLSCGFTQVHFPDKSLLKV